MAPKVRCTYPIILRRFFCRFLLVFSCIVMSVPLYADEASLDAMGWLKAMRDARKHLDFHGTAALLRNNQVQMVAVSHCVTGGVERESMYSLDDPGQEVVRKAGHSSYFLPEAQRKLAGGKTPLPGGVGVLPDELAGYQRFYRFSLGSQERLIGRQAQEVIIEPVDEYRYGRRFWIDVDTRLPLKYQVFGNGQILEQLVFSELTLDAAPKPSPATGPENTAHRPETLPLESLRWRLAQVPPGYQWVSYTRHHAPGRPPLEHLLLSDGLSALSLYIETTDNVTRLKKQLHRFGAVNLYLRFIGAYQITVMGEAPAAAVGLVGDNVRRVEQP